MKIAYHAAPEALEVTFISYRGDINEQRESVQRKIFDALHAFAERNNLGVGHVNNGYSDEAGAVVWIERNSLFKIPPEWTAEERERLMSQHGAEFIQIFKKIAPDAIAANPQLTQAIIAYHTAYRTFGKNLRQKFKLLKDMEQLFSEKTQPTEQEWIQYKLIATQCNALLESHRAKAPKEKFTAQIEELDALCQALPANSIVKDSLHYFIRKIACDSGYEELNELQEAVNKTQDPLKAAGQELLKTMKYYLDSPYVNKGDWDKLRRFAKQCHSLLENPNSIAEIIDQLESPEMYLLFSTIPVINHFHSFMYSVTHNTFKEEISKTQDPLKEAGNKLLNAMDKLIKAKEPTNKEWVQYTKITEQCTSLLNSYNARDFNTEFTLS